MSNEKSDFDQLLEDAEMQVPDEEGMKGLARLGAKLLSLRQEKEALETRAKEVAKEIKQLEETDIPTKMAELGVLGFRLSSGEQVDVEDYIHASIPKKNEVQAFAWLEENGHGDLIKSEIKVALGRGDLEQAQKILALLEEQGIPDAEFKKAVAWNTLTAFVREQLSQGEDLPHETLGIYIGKKVTIK